jgi:hypothetical protein
MASAKSREEDPFGFSQITSHAIRKESFDEEFEGFMKRAGFQRFLG